MAVEQVIKISLDDLKALGGIDNLKKSLGETEQSTKSLKQQLREATAEVAQMAEKYGEASKETVQAAKRAAELKDKIEDANDAIMAFKGEGAFLATGKALQSVASGFAAAQGAMGLFGSESENVEKAILKVQSAMALAQGLEGLEDASRAFTQLKTVAVNAFNAIKGAIGATGIGALVIALGAVYYYWDDIKEAVSGVSEEQQRLNEKTAANLEISKKNLDSLGAQDNILKLQGKSEKEIIALKLKKYEIAIKDAKANLTAVTETNIQAYEGTVRNANLTKKILNAIVVGGLQAIRILTDPLDMLLQGASAVAKALGGKGFDFSINAELYKQGQAGVSALTKLLFNPEEIKTEGEKAIQAANDVLTKLENDRAGLILTQRVGSANSTKSSGSISKGSELSEEQLVNLENEKNYQQVSLQNFKDSELMRVDVAKLADENMTMNAIEQANLRMEIAEIEARQRRESIMAVADAFGAASEIIGQETAVGKGLAIAQAIMNTYLGVTEALRQKSTLPSPFDVVAKVANVATVVATGLKAVKQITAVKVGARGGGGSGAPSMGGLSATAQQPQFNVAGNAGVNQIASTLANQPPIKAYVVGKEVSTQQSLDRNIVKNATLG